MALVVLPDAELVTVTFLRSVPEIAALAADRVYTAVPAGPTYPLVVARRFGGPDSEEQTLDAARIQLDSYGAGKAEARLLAATCRAAMVLRMQGAHSNGGYVTGVVPGMKPSWQPQGENNQPCYIQDLVIYLQPDPLPA